MAQIKEIDIVCYLVKYQTDSPKSGTVVRTKREMYSLLGKRIAAKPGAQVCVRPLTKWPEWAK